MKTTGSNSGALKKPRADGQLSGLAGELFVAAELLKRGLQTSITFGNAKAIDLLVHNPSIERTFTVHVKALRNPNFFLIGHKSVRSSLLSAFRAAVYFKHMPIIAVFFGIVVRMFYKEHEPAHFHAEHQGQQAKFDFSGNVVAGQIQ